MAKKKSLLRRFFGGIWRAVMVLFVLTLLFVFIAVPIGIYLTYFTTPEIKVAQQSVLVWAPAGDLTVEQDGVGSLLERFMAQPDSVTLVRDVTHMLERAAADDRIQKVLLQLDELGAAQPGQLQELAQALRRLRESGKEVVAWARDYDQRQYLLASMADEVYVDPLGGVYLQGFGIFRNYYARALERLDIEINVFRVGKYKAAIEPFVRDDMSPQAKAANRALLDSLWNSYRSRVAQARQLSPQAIDDYMADYPHALASFGGDAAQLALEAGLVDAVASMTELQDELARQTGGTGADDVRRIDGRRYLAATAAEQAESDAEHRIALVTIDGPIVAGAGMAGATGSDTAARLINRARRDERVAALVLRIDSPGGSADAAEQIRRQVERLLAAGKPVVVSMAGMAASGGYWIGLDADQIWAQPMTLTGSIGVFGLVPTFGATLDNLGISHDGVATSELAGAYRIDKPLSDAARSMLQSSVEHIYRLFVGKVAAARNLSADAAEQAAQGRVWSGADAVRIGLVDQLGGLQQAVVAAAELAGLEADEYRLQPLRAPSDWRHALKQLLSVRLAHVLLPDWLAALTDNRMTSGMQLYFDDPRNIYARCFCRVVPDG